MFKVGDILTARKTLYMNNHLNEKEFLFLLKDKKYKITDVDINRIFEWESVIIIKSEYKLNHRITFDRIEKYFYTQKELRKLKLNKLK